MFQNNNQSVKSLINDPFGPSSSTVQDLFNRTQQHPFDGFGSMTQIDDAVRKFFFKNAQNAQLYQFMVDNELNFENNYGSIRTIRQSENKTPSTLIDTSKMNSYQKKKLLHKSLKSLDSDESSSSNTIVITIELYELCTIRLTITKEYGVQSTPKIEVSGYSIATNIADVENRLKRLFLS